MHMEVFFHFSYFFYFHFLSFLSPTFSGAWKEEERKGLETFIFDTNLPIYGRSSDMKEN